ncbi:MAG TPA: hypothetical protein VNJ08_11185 [Bacteriovoracaceae bacterium]|nr:hypothetical protein [Bacteriovoracaceae bacterium]
MANPTLGTGSLVDGTYPCVMITMDDVLKFKPTANDGTNCVAGTEYAIDLCRDFASTGSVIHSSSEVLEGTTFTDTDCIGTNQSVAAGGIANKVTLFLRISAPANNHADAGSVSAFAKGTLLSGTVSTNPADNRIQLASPFIVSGTKTGVFYVDATNKISDTGAACDMAPPLFGFRDP